GPSRPAAPRGGRGWRCTTRGPARPAPEPPRGRRPPTPARQCRRPRVRAWTVGSRCRDGPLGPALQCTHVPRSRRRIVARAGAPRRYQSGRRSRGDAAVRSLSRKRRAWTWAWPLVWVVVLALSATMARAQDAKKASDKPARALNLKEPVSYRVYQRDRDGQA